MSFDTTKTLQDTDSGIQIDVESMARIEISDIEYLLEKAASEKDFRLQRILYETLVTKTASVFQLAMRACKYLGINCKQQLITPYSKDSQSGIGRIGTFRENLFHDGISFIQKETYFPFGKITGRGFVAIRVNKGATFNIKDIYCFHSKESEYAITSEGFFEITNSGTPDEEWVLLDPFHKLEATNYETIMSIVQEALNDLKTIWYDLACVRKTGDGQHEYSYMNKGGTWELIEKNKDGQTMYQADQKTLQINGQLTITPPNSILIENNKLTYE